MGQKEPPRLGNTICYGQTWARKSHRDSAVRFDTAKSCPERATKTRQYDLLRPRIVQKEQPRLGSTIRYGKEFGSTICYVQEWARKSHQDSAVRFGAAKHGPERATKTRQYDLLRPERATKTRQYDLLRPIVGQKEPARLGSTICYGRTWTRKSHQDSAVRFVAAKRVPEKATKTRQYDLLSHQDCPEKAAKTRQYDLLRPRAGKKEPLRIGSTICSGQTWARKSHQDSAIRFVSAKRGPERATETRQYDLLRPNLGQKEPPRLGSTICCGQTWARKSHRDSVVRFVTAKRGPERATKTRQYDLLRPRVGQKEPPRLGSTICYGQTWARKSHQDSAVRFGQKEPPRLGSTIWPERATMGQKEPPRLGSTICYGQDLARKNHQDSAVRLVTAKHEPERVIKTRQYDLISAKSWPEKVTDSTIRFVPAKSCPERATKTRQYDLISAKSWSERATKTRQYDLLRPGVDQKEPPYDLLQLQPKVGKKEPPRLGSTICYGQELARKSHQDSALRFVTAKSWPERATKTRQYDLLRPRVGQEEAPRRFVTAKSWPERATETRQYDLLQPNVGQKEPSRLGRTICYGQELARKEPPRLGCTICYGQTWVRKSHQDSAVRFVTGKSWPERATKTRQYDLLRPNLGQKEPPRLGSTICCGQTWARKSHRDSAVRFVTAKTWPERSAVRFVAAKRGPERATKTRQYDLLRPRVGQKKQPRLGSTICYGQELARKSRRDSAVRCITAKRGPERATKTRQYD